MKEARTFVRTHPDNPEWHCVDLPLGSPHYPDTGQSDPNDPVLPFTSSHDIVHMIQRCIEILEAETESPQFTRLRHCDGFCTSWKTFTNRSMWPRATTVPRLIRSPIHRGLTTRRRSHNSMPKMTAAGTCCYF